MKAVGLNSTGIDHDQFAVSLNLLSIPEAAQFVAREKELAEMYEVLCERRLIERGVVILHGLGGIGKTQLAIRYAMQHKEKYTAVFWLNTNDEDSLKLSFRDLAQQISRHNPPTFSGIDLHQNLDKTVNAVKDWFELPNNIRWLMIFDNYDNPKTPNNPDNSAIDIRRFLPQANHDSIIITTRSSQVTLGRRIQVQKLSNAQESLQILSNMSSREEIENGRSL